MRTYQRRPNMEVVPYGGKAKHPEHAAVYELPPAAAAAAHLKKADAELAAVQDRLHKLMQGSALSSTQRTSIQSAYTQIGLARGALGEARG